MENTVKITEGESDERLFLNIHTLEVNTTDSKFAYLEDIDVGITKFSKPFVKFILRDRSGHIIVGRKFNIDDIESKGEILSKLKKNVVAIEYEVGTFEGEIALKINTVKLTPSKIMSREDFVGKLEGVQEDLTTLKKYVDSICDTKYSLICNVINSNNLLEGIEYSKFDLYGMRSGGCLKFTVNLLKTLRAQLDDADWELALPLTILNEVFMTAYYEGIVEEKSIFSLGEDKSDVTRTSETLYNSIIKTVKAKKPELLSLYEPLCIQGKNLTKAVIGSDKSRTYINHVILENRNLLYKLIQLKEVNESMINHSYKKVEGLDELLVKM